jgi:hypothetical protein
MSNAHAMSRLLLVAALALALTAAPSCVAASGSVRAAARGQCHANGTNSVAASRREGAGQCPTQWEPVADQSDGYDMAPLTGAVDVIWTDAPHPADIIASSLDSRGGAWLLHSLIAQRTCLRL